MANQRTPTTNTVENITVEKIILSGSPFVSAILGPGAYRIIANSAPVFYTDPLVTGNVVVPTTLHCDEGSFNSSPRADVTYQWFYDDVSMTGETNNTIDIDDSNITRIVNGEDVLNTYPTFKALTTSHVRADNISFPTTAITVEFWVKAVNSGGNVGALFSYAQPAEANEFGLFFSGAIRLSLNGTVYETGVAIDNGLWRHVAITWQSSDGEVLLYIDGVQRWNNNVQTGQSLVTPGILLLGQEQDSYGGGFSINQVLDGSMCEFRIWNDVRTVEEIEDNRFDILIGNESGLVTYWRLDEGTGSVANDLSATDIDGVISNMDSWTIESGPVFTDREIITFLGTDQPYHCVVSLVNDYGSTSAQSNDLQLELVAEGFLYEMDIYVLQGLTSTARIDMNDADMMIVSGLEHNLKIDMNEAEINVVTGVSHLAKIDMNEAEIDVISGFANIDKLDVDEADLYITFTPEFLTPLVVINGNADNTDMSDWTMDSGNVTSVNTAPGWGIDDYRTGRFFKADDLGQGVDSQMSQVMAVAVADESDIDDGKCYAFARFKFFSELNWDTLFITLTALNAADGVLATQTFDVPAYPPYGGFSNVGWLTHNFQDGPLSMPTLTRKVKITILFEANAGGSPGNNAYIDEIEVDIMRIDS